MQNISTHLYHILFLNALISLGRQESEGNNIIALGGKQSASADKVWSSPSDIPAEAVGASPPVPLAPFSSPVAGSSAKAASKAPQPVLGAAVPGAPVGHPAAAKAGATAKEQTSAAPPGADGFGRGDSPLRGNGDGAGSSQARLRWGRVCR